MKRLAILVCLALCTPAYAQSRVGHETDARFCLMLLKKLTDDYRTNAPHRLALETGFNTECFMYACPSVRCLGDAAR
jgi:hypothetical protein